ncbi:MAG: DUF5615 family PIN-like protein [Propionibacteriaceae bacterium]|jgi:hypothetical protein|nr:DUF5615 family PIN-like protein [Propionibacteriaceae bacterium]
MSRPTPRILLDEHYPASLASLLMAEGIDVVAISVSGSPLLGATDTDVLKAATSQGRVVVTEDVSTFPYAIAAVPDHVGVVYCRSSVFRRAPDGIRHLAKALTRLLANPPVGLGSAPIVWWLEPVE